ncbi:hypothetical protein MRX96_052024 [Rhipicephalus microplus]
MNRTGAPRSLFKRNGSVEPCEAPKRVLQRPCESASERIRARLAVRANIEHRERRTRRKGNRPPAFQTRWDRTRGPRARVQQRARRRAGVTLPGRGQRSASTRFCQNVGRDNGNWSR